MDNLYIDAMPVLNVHYREYRHFMRSSKLNLDTLEQMSIRLPYSNFSIGNFFKKYDFTSNQDSSGMAINDSIKTFWNGWVDYGAYLKSLRFNFFPMVNISYNEAATFCKWRTFVVKILYATHKKRERKKLYDDLVYRLPTFEELELATRKFAMEKKLIFQMKATADSLPSFPDNPQTIDIFRVSRLSEIATDKNFIRMAKWNTPLYNLLKDGIIQENTFSENLGFRCVCDVRSTPAKK